MKKKAHSIDMLFMLVLFSVFAVMSVLLILIGSNVYGNIVDSQEVNGSNRNVLSYVTNKVRASQVQVLPLHKDLVLMITKKFIVQSTQQFRLH